MTASIRGLIFGIPTLETTGGGGGGGSVSDATLRMSHIAATRPYVVLLTGDDIATTSGRQLHIHAIADGS